MNVKLRMVVLRITRRLWFRWALYGLLAIATALVGTFAKGLIPEGLATRIGAAAVGNILGILASGMLAVTTFSLSIRVSASAAASYNATPRASTLLIEDSGSQQALARDRAGMLEVASRLQQSLATLGQLGCAPCTEPAAAQAERTLQFSARIMVIPDDVRVLREIAHARAAST